MSTLDEVIQRFALLLTLLLGQLISGCISSSVSLTAEGGVSLVGSHCPVTVRLFCEGVGLTFLRWRYNETDLGMEFFPDSEVTTLVNHMNAAIINVQLTNVSQNPTNPRLANFSSTLTVDLSQLEQQNILSISCDSAGISETVPVDVHIIQETAPKDPQLISVNASSACVDEKSNLSMLRVLITWEQPVSLIFDICVLFIGVTEQITECAEFKERLYYQAVLFLDGVNFTTTVNSNFCATTPSVCSVAFNASSEKTVSRRNNYTVSIQAINSVGKSNTTTISGFLLGKSVYA